MRGYLLLIVIIFSAYTVEGQEQTSMSLEECLKYAERNQVKIKNAMLDYNSAIARNKEVTGSALPQLTAKGALNYAPLVAAFQVPDFISGVIKQTVKPEALDSVFLNSPIGTLPLAFQPKWTTTGSAELSQILFNPDIMVALRARKTLEELAAKSVDLTIQDVKVAVSKAYYNVLIAEKQKDLIESNIARISQMQTETKEIYNAGFAEKIDVDRISVTLNNLKTQQIRIDQMINLAYLSLKFQMGMPLEEDVNLRDSLDASLETTGILVQELDYNARNEFQLLQIQKRLYGFDVKRYRMGWLPTLNLFGNYGYTLYNMNKLFDPQDNWQKSSLIGLNLNVPLFDGFQRRNKLKQAQITLEKNENDIDNLKMALTLENESARITLRNNLLALNNQKENMILAEEVYNTASIKYKEGVGSSLEVLDAESALKEAQTNYFQALYDVTTARIDLQKALGLIN